MHRDDVYSYVSDEYGISPDFPWIKTPDAAVLRHRHNRKWFALIMNVKKSSLGIKGDGTIDIINLKIEPLVREILLAEHKAYLAYHMNKNKWISLPLDGSIASELICGLIDESYRLTK